MPLFPTFGDLKYFDAPLIPPMAYYPRASMGAPLQDALTCLYLDAQWHSRLIFCQSWTYNLRDLGGDLTNTRRARGSTTYFGIARARRTLPEDTTHIVCNFTYAVASFLRTIVRLRLTATAGVNTDVRVQPDFETSDASGGSSSESRSYNQRGADLAQFPYSDGHDVYTNTVVLTLANIDTTGAAARTRVYLEGYAIRELGLAAEPIMPLSAICTAETRYLNG